MSIRSPRGVQQHQVDRAADELLAQGQRPTIEKVRLHLGHGSPNTIAPMLELWFAGLGKRVRGLAGSQGWGDQLPDWLLQSAETLWNQAQVQAKAVAESELDQERQGLAQREADLHEQATALQQRMAIHQATLQAQEQALAEARAQSAALLSRLEQTKSDSAQQHQMMLGLQEDLRLLRERRHADEDRHQAELKTLNEDRRKTEERADSAAARAALEIDRARQEAKAERAHRQRAEKLLEELREAHQSAMAQAQQQAAEMQQALGLTQAELKLAQERLSHQQTELLKLQQMQASWTQRQSRATVSATDTPAKVTGASARALKPARAEPPSSRAALRSAARPGGGGVRLRRRTG